MTIVRATQRFFFSNFSIPSFIPNVTWFPELSPSCLSSQGRPQFLMLLFKYSTEDWWQNLLEVSSQWEIRLGPTSLPVLSLALAPSCRQRYDALHLGPALLPALQPRASAADDQSSPYLGPHYTSCPLCPKGRCYSALTSHQTPPPAPAGPYKLQHWNLFIPKDCLLISDLPDCTMEIPGVL